MMSGRRCLPRRGRRRSRSPFQDFLDQARCSPTNSRNKDLRVGLEDAGSIARLPFEPQIVGERAGQAATER